MSVINSLYFLTLIFFNILLFSALIKWSPKLGFLDYPNYRKVHTTLVPRNGGLIVFINLVAYFFLFKPTEINSILIPLSIIFAGGFIDDFKQNLPASFKILFQFFGSALFLYQLNLPWPLKIIFFFFQIGITNSYNLLDNMNGVTVLLTLSQVLAFYILDPLIFFNSFFLYFFISSLLAFLFFNFPRGKIFLGDQGSQLLGFLMSQIILTYLSQAIKDKTNLNFSEIVIMTLLLAGFFFLFVTDTFTVIFIRLKNKKNILQGDQNHLTHKLHQAGVNKSIIPLLLLPVQLSCSLIFGYFLIQFLGHLQ